MKKSKLDVKTTLQIKKIYEDYSDLWEQTKDEDYLDIAQDYEVKKWVCLNSLRRVCEDEEMSIFELERVLKGLL